MTKEQLAYVTLYDAALTTDNIWSDELVLAFGRAAGDKRYTREGEGFAADGSVNLVLRAAYLRRYAAHKRWDEARQARQAASVYRPIEADDLTFSDF